MKACFGTYLSRACHDHHNCEYRGDCNVTTNQNGPCDCPHKRNCHVGRQSIQAKFREEDPRRTIQHCHFWGYFADEKK